MLFNSPQFLLFLPVVLAVYYLLPHRGQNWFLLAASCYFYAAWDWRFLAPLLFSTTVDYFCARQMEKSIVRGEAPSQRKRYLAVSLVANLSLLGFFKYFDFFAGSLQRLIGELGWHIQPWTLQVILPIGISFYTFQALSYTIDVYRGEIHAARNFWDFLLCVIFFPHLVAGPIQRARSLLPQVMFPRSIRRDQVIEGVHLMVWGYFQKVYIADNIGAATSWIFSLPHPTGFNTLIGMYAFAVQIFCDFSGYTDIARGVAKLMGFEFMLNFNLPYFAANPQEFWQRWHISLSTWFRDYLYIPLGGNRNGTARAYFNLTTTMLIAGLWHGAAWHFVLWGAYHGVLLVAHRLLKPVLSRITFVSAFTQGAWRAARVLFMFQLTCLGWLIFRASSAAALGAMIASLFHGIHFSDMPFAIRVATLAAPLLLVQSIQALSGKLAFLDFRWIPAEARAVVYAAFVYCILFRGGPSRAFIYFQF
jgi:alginate O-acetyltransferase complex protein AlgI